MGIKKLLTVAALLAAGGLTHSAWAQTDVTSTYLTNADFEGEYKDSFKVNTNRYIYKPNNWTLNFKSESSNNITILTQSDPNASNFSGDYAVPDGTKRYMVRFRDRKPNEFIDLSQTFTVQSTGIYTFSADLIREDGSQVNVLLYAESSSVQGEISNAKPGVWENRSFEILLLEGDEVTVGLRFTNLDKAKSTGYKIGADNVKITFKETSIATNDDYALLNSAIAAAEAKTLGFEAGEYAPYNNVAALKALAAAKAIDPESDNTAEVVVDATTALNNATWTANETDVDAIYNGDFANSTPNATSGVDVDVPGWTWVEGMRLIVDDAETDLALANTNAGKALFSWGGTTMVYGEKEGYTLPLAAHTVYELSFKYAGWRDGEMGYATASVLNANNEGLKSTQTGNATKRINVEDAFATHVVRFTTGEAGDYKLTLWVSKHMVITDVTITKAPEATATMSISAAKYGTFIAPFDVEIPAGVTASKITGIDANGVTLTEEAVEGTIPANTPVLLYSETEVNKEFTAQSLATQDTYTVGRLTGNLSGETIKAPKNSYILLNGANGVGFYRVVTEDVTVNNNRVYLTVPAAQAKAFFSFGGGATGINGIEGAEGATEVVRFNAAGVQVAAPVKGLNIVKMSDGTVKKVMVK